ncbi:hypothetical protein SBA4_3300006 [Candidatus Sulfopaludibacter sp. SbA4]|nr:hypothetical protein SBA4_3300006 [Candidatus Sulfopaludibacter sp. SbA4]
MTKDLIAKLTTKADAFDARIKQVAGMEEKGFWLCEDGHEDEDANVATLDPGTPPTRFRRQARFSPFRVSAKHAANP